VTLDASALRFGYTGDSPLFEGLDLQVDAGESVAVLAPSGAGKTSLLLCLAGILVPQDGDVTICGASIARLSASRRASFRLRHIGMVFQTGGLLPELSVVENVAIPLVLAGGARSACLQRAADALDRLGIAGLLERRVDQLSGGQVQRVGIARALIHEPALVIADEPTGMLDESTSRLVVEELVSATTARGAALVVATHDTMVAEACDRALFLHDGALSAEPSRA
jgi:putative ABC transport system ATP-binding protein